MLAADGSPALVASLRFAAFALLAIVAPGLAIQRLLGLRPDAALVLPLGYAFAAAAAALSLASERIWLFPVLVGLLGLALLLRRAPAPRAPAPSLRAVVPALAAVVALLLLAAYPLNRRLPSGGFALDPLERVDTAFHVAVTWELVNHPPQVPGFSGRALDYHYGPHLVRAMAQRLAGTHPYDAMARFDVTLQAVALVLALRAAALALGGGALAAVLAPLTLLFGDLAWAFGAQARWWTELMAANILVALVFGNSLVCGLAMALGALLAVSRHLAGGGRAWLAVAATLGLALPFFKVFVAAQVAACALVAALAARRRGLGLLAFALPAALGLAWLATSQRGPGLQLLFDPLSPVSRLRQLLGLPPAEGLALVGWGVLWLALALGPRVLALRPAWRAAAGGDPVAAALGVAALAGWPVALLLVVTADGEFNEAVYFTIVSGALLWLFAARAVERVGAGSRRWLALAALAALSLPTTLEFVWRRARTAPDVVPAGVLEAMQRLQWDSRPGDVVLMRPLSRHPPAPAVFVGRRVAYTSFFGYAAQFVPPAELRRRAEAVQAFFRTDSPAEARSIAGELRARHVFLEDPDSRLGRGARELLEPLYVAEDAALFRLR